jgi:uncharacterized protein (DUF58 family)
VSMMSPGGTSPAKTRLGPSRWRAIRRFFRPPRTLRVTRSGKTYLIITVGVGLGALNTGNNLLYLVLGLLLSIVVYSGVLSERCLRRLDVERLGSDAAFAHEAFAFRWLVRSRGGPAFAIEIQEDETQLEGRGTVGYVGPDEERVVRADMLASRRGPWPLTGVKVTTTFPLGLFAKSRVLDIPGKLLVFPKRIPPVGDVAGQHQAQPGDAGNPLKKDGTGDLLGLRELAPGEDSRQVHWMKSAAVGKLLRTEREREERRAVVLRLSNELPLAALDTECEQLAAKAHRLLATGYEVGFECGPLRLRPAAGGAQEVRILKALAVAGYEANP